MESSSVESTINRFIGESRDVEKIRLFIRNASLYDYPVLLIGETGVGKELVANLIHELSKRRGGSFVILNCSNLPESLVESGLFGYRKGAFTDARENRDGLCEEANKGTFFLDEIAECSLTVQTKLLRLIDNQEIRRLGESRTRKVDVRFVAATNRNIKKEVEEGRFRKDLFYRLNILYLYIPPLRQRRKDIPLLIDYILEKENNKLSAKKDISPEFMKKLLAYNYPGNVRELENIIKRFLVSSYEDGVSEFTLDFQKEDDAWGEIPFKLYSKMRDEGKSFWEVIYRPFLERELNRKEVRKVIHMGLSEAGGSYKKLLSIFNINTEAKNYKKFMDFLRHARLK